MQHVIEVDEGNTAVIACHLPESHPKAQVRYSVKQEWLEASRGKEWAGSPGELASDSFHFVSAVATSLSPHDNVDNPSLRLASCPVL